MCVSGFMYIHSISDTRLKNLRKHYKDNGAVPRTFQHKGRNNKAVNFNDAKLIFDFLQGYAETHALELPGRVPGTVY